MQTTRGHHSFSHIINFLKSLSPLQRSLISEVCTLVNLILVVPATNAVSGRSAQGYDESSPCVHIIQQCLNNLIVIHVHKDKTGKLDLKSCLSDFVAESEHRSGFFGHFLILEHV